MSLNSSLKSWRQQIDGHSGIALPVVCGEWIFTGNKYSKNLRLRSHRWDTLISSSHIFCDDVAETMGTDVLIRDVPGDVLDRIDRMVPTGSSRVGFLRDELSRRYGEPRFTRDMFVPGVEPRKVVGQLPFKFIDLFAGVGGFRSAMTALGGECVFTSEWDRFSAQTYAAWYGDNHIHQSDIRDLDIEKEVPDHDVLCAGFPCQPFSLAGVSKKQSLGRKHGFDDEKQGNLFFSIMKIVDLKRPPILFLENVKNLVSHDKGNTWKVIRAELESRGYNVHAKVVDARSWVPQHRERIFIVCFDNSMFGGLDAELFNFPNVDDAPQPRLHDVLEDRSPDRKYMLSDKLWNYLQEYAEKHRLKGNGFGFGLVGRRDVARTLSARYHKDGSEILVKQKGFRNPRRLTPAEAGRLMGFEQRYASMFGHEGGFPQVVSDTQAYRQFGNAVVPLVVEAIGRGVVDVMAAKLTEGSGCLLKGRWATRRPRAARSTERAAEVEA